MSLHELNQLEALSQTFSQGRVNTQQIQQLSILLDQLNKLKHIKPKGKK